MNSPHASRRIVAVATLLVAAGMVFVESIASATAGETKSRPNVLFLLADDQCYETIAALGNAEIKTPNLDRLVRRGTVFTHAYNQGSWTGAVCVASRTMLSTGRFLWNAHAVVPKLERERAAGRFWSEYLRRAGYETYMTGKWHLQADAHKAFDHVVHVRPGMPAQTPAGYHRPKNRDDDAWKPWDPKAGGFWQGGKHWSEVLADDAVGFVRQAAKRDKPFFMYLAFNAPHDPRQSPKPFVERYPEDKIALPRNFLPEYPHKEAMGAGKKLRDEQLAPFPRTPHAVKVHRQEYFALITHMDAQIGKILDALEASGKADNTYVFFAADHGLAVGHHGLMGKQNLYDHSVRVPLIVVGPGVQAGRRIDAAVYLQDVMPTTLQIAGVAKPDHVQFRSLLPRLRGESDRGYEAIYGAYLDRQRMVTQGDYKLILYPKIAKARLYNLRDDPDEMSDLADNPKSEPIMKRLFAQLRKLQSETGDSLDLASIYPGLR